MNAGAEAVKHAARNFEPLFVMAKGGITLNE
jgi:hypothetical protein